MMKKNTRLSIALLILPIILFVISVFISALIPQQLSSEKSLLVILAERLFVLSSFAALIGLLLSPLPMIFLIRGILHNKRLERRYLKQHVDGYRFNGSALWYNNSVPETSLKSVRANFNENSIELKYDDGKIEVINYQDITKAKFKVFLWSKSAPFIVFSVANKQKLLFSPLKTESIRKLLKGYGRYFLFSNLLGTGVGSVIASKDVIVDSKYEDDVVIPFMAYLKKHIKGVTAAKTATDALLIEALKWTVIYFTPLLLAFIMIDSYLDLGSYSLISTVVIVLVLSTPIIFFGLRSYKSGKIMVNNR